MGKGWKRTEETYCVVIANVIRFEKSCDFSGYYREKVYRRKSWKVSDSRRLIGC